jgi:hypothetical protein
VEVELVPAVFPPDPIATPRVRRGDIHLSLEVFDVTTGQTVDTTPFATTTAQSALSLAIGLSLGLPVMRGRSAPLNRLCDVRIEMRNAQKEGTMIRRHDRALRTALGLACIAAAVLSTSVQSSPAPAGAVLEPFFTQVARTPPPPPVEKDPSIIRRARVEVSDKALASGVILSAEAHLLNFFPDVELLALRSRVESRSRSDYSWFGYFPGDEFGRVVITVVRGTLGMSATYKGKHYAVLARVAGGHEVLELDPDVVFDPDDVGSAPPRAADSRDGSQVPFGSRTSGAVTVGTPLDLGGMFHSVPWTLIAGDLPRFTFVEDRGEVIDVLVLYTHDAVTEAEFDLHSEIQIGVADANESFHASGIQTTLKMVPLWALEVDFDETGSFENDLYTLASNTFIRGLRDSVAADLVVLFERSGDACGRAYVNESFAVVKATAGCMAKYSFAHEVGHMMGARHDWFKQIADGLPEPSNWSQVDDANGYIQIASLQPGGAVRTMMAQPHGCAHVGITCPRILRWSKPDDLTQNGLPLGIWQGLPRPANDSRALSANRHAVANRRHSICRLLDGC